MKIDMINTITGKLGLSGLRSTALRVEEQVVATPAEVLKAFITFGGEGWLLTAQGVRPHIGTRFEECEGEWPEEGERFNEASSLRVQRCPRGWFLTLIEETSGSDILARSVRQLADGSEGALLYEVYYREECRDNEWRPFTCRFAGFEKGRINHV